MVTSLLVQPAEENINECLFLPASSSRQTIVSGLLKLRPYLLYSADPNTGQKPTLSTYTVKHIFGGDSKRQYPQQERKYRLRVSNQGRRPSSNHMFYCSKFTHV